jgi:ATP-dependent Clp protease ATP-binding subunit ClpA
MFERFTDRSRRAVVLAQEEARALNHRQIGTEHLLLGVLREGEGLAGTVLRSLGLTLDATRHEVEAITGRGQEQASGHIPFTPRAKKTLELSFEESLRLGHSHIGTEHLLLGLIGQDNVATQVLRRLKVDLNDLREQVIGELSGVVRELEFSHYVEKDKIAESMATGTPVTALCGKVWVPRRDPKRYPVCPSCKSVYEQLPSGETKPAVP